MEIPENKIAVAFIYPKAIAAVRIELEQELVIKQQFEQIAVEGGSVVAKPADLLRPRQRSEGGGNGGIANSKQRAGTWRFQYHLVATPAQIGGTRHLSAAQFIFDQRDATALVASQDGRFTVFKWSPTEQFVHAHRVDALLL